MVLCMGVLIQRIPFLSSWFSPFDFTEFILPAWNVRPECPPGRVPASPDRRDYVPSAGGAPSATERLETGMEKGAECARVARVARVAPAGYPDLQSFFG